MKRLLFVCAVLFVGCKTTQIAPGLTEAQTNDAVSSAVIATAVDTAVSDAEYLLSLAESVEDKAAVHIATQHLKDVKLIAATAETQASAQKEERKSVSELTSAYATIEKEAVKAKGQKNTFLFALIAIGVVGALYLFFKFKASILSLFGRIL